MQLLACEFLRERLYLSTSLTRSWKSFHGAHGPAACPRAVHTACTGGVIRSCRDCGRSHSLAHRLRARRRQVTLAVRSNQYQVVGGPSTPGFVRSFLGSTAVLRKFPHSNCCKTVQNRTLRGRRGRFGTLLQLLECGIFWRTAVTATRGPRSAKRRAPVQPRCLWRQFYFDIYWYSTSTLQERSRPMNGEKCAPPPIDARICSMRRFTV